MNTTSLLVRLRAETADAHRAIEEALGLVDDGLTLAGYGQRLRQFYGFYKPVEEQLVAGQLLVPWLKLEERLKTPLLAQDLSVLKIANIHEIVLSRNLPALHSPAQCFGCLYVLEGATLGGVIISRHIRQRLGITPATGGKFFDGYGERTGERWHAFRAALTAFDESSQNPDLVIAAACATFETLRHWCEGS